MSRRVRHVHARPGEHIYVHRHDHPRRPRTPRPTPVVRYTPSYSSSYVTSPACRSTYTPPENSFWKDVPWWVYVGGIGFVVWALAQIPVRIYVITAAVVFGVPLALLGAYGAWRLIRWLARKWAGLSAERRRTYRRAAWWTLLTISLSAPFVFFPVESSCVSAVVATAGLLVHRRRHRRRKSAEAPMIPAPEAPQAGEEASAASSFAAEAV